MGRLRQRNQPRGWFLKALMATAAAAPIAPRAHAETWTGAASTNWFDPTNWSPASVPTSGTATTTIENVANDPVIDSAAANSGSLLYVGQTSSGASLTIQNAGTLTSATSEIGAQSGSSGAVAVTGVGSKWTTGATDVGATGSGSLTVSAGGAVSLTGNMVAAFNGGGVGNILVTGSGSSVSITNQLQIGRNLGAHGAMTVSGGASVSDSQAFIGVNSGSVGSAIVDGAGSAWSNSTGLDVGNTGNATLTIQNGGAVSSGTSNIGRNVGSVGSATVTGSGSSWTSSGVLTIGGSASGALTVNNGGAVSASSITLANAVGSTGTLTVGQSGGGIGAGSVSGNISFGAGTGALVFNHNSTTYTFASNISGGSLANSSISVLAGATTLTGNNSAFGGSTSVSGGRLQVNGSLAGPISVAIGGTLGVGGTISGNVSDNGALIFENSSAFLYGGVISGTGTLTVQGAGVLTLSGNSSGFAGNVTTDGGGHGVVTGSLGAATFIVGRDGVGAFDITSGGSVTASGETYVGYNTGSDGVLTLTGVGSTFDATGAIHVGYNGTGTLNIFAGGLVDPPDFYIGEFANGVVNVDGAGSTLEAGNLTIGVDATGDLNVTSGGAVTSDLATLGQNSGGVGNVTIDGTGSSWTNDGQLIIANAGTATATIRNDGDASATGNVTIGDVSGSTGALNVDGVGSTFDAAADLTIGSSGSGSVNVTNGGALTSVNTAVGVNAGSSGAVHVSDTGSSWSNSGSLSIGVAGDGQMFVQDGGQLSALAGATIATQAGGTGSVTVDGVDALFAAGDDSSDQLIVGDGGDGLLDVSNNGAVTNAGNTVAGNQLGGTGTITAHGAGTLSTNGLTIGAAGAGTLNVYDSGSSVHASTAVIGSLAGSDGEANVHDSGAFSVDGALTVGDAGAGALNATAGGAMSSNGGSIGSAATGDGTAIVDASTWTADTGGNGFIVGDAGAGALTVRNGGSLSTNTATIGVTGSGQATVTTGGQWTSGAMNVGYDSGGAQDTLTISAGGGVNSTSGQIGVLAGSNGAANITGSGSGWTIANSLVVGAGGAGALTIDDAGALSTANAVIGRDAGSSGSIAIDNSGSWTNTNALSIGGNGSAGGAGSLSISNGGSYASLLGQMYVGNGGGGSVTVDTGGTLNVYDLQLGLLSSGELHIASGGIVTNTFATVGFNHAASADVDAATWNATNLYVGEAAAGELTLTNDAQLVGTQIVLGDAAAGDGTLTASTSSDILLSGSAVIGNFGQGQLTLQTGATMGSGVGVIGQQTDSFGRVDVSAATWTSTGALYVGYNGEGELGVSAGGSVSADQTYIGYGVASSGSVVAEDAGSSFSTGTGNVVIGYSGDGSFHLLGGATATTGVVFVGYNAGSSGSLEIDGAGSQLDASQAVQVGRDGGGSLDITNGGVLNSVGGYVASTDVGTVNVSGAGSEWNSTLGIQVGGAGIATFIISSGGLVNTTSITLGDFTGGSGHMVVKNDGSLLSAGGALILGEQGQGILSVLDSGEVGADSAILGDDASGRGTLNLFDAASTVNVTNDMVVANLGRASVFVDGGSFLNDATAYVGGGASGIGSVAVRGVGSAWNNSNVVVIGYDGLGAVQVADAGTLNATNGIVLALNAGSTGTLTIGGTGPVESEGSITTPIIMFGAGDGNVVFNHNSTNLVFSTPFAGASGLISFNAGTTNLTGNSSSYTGAAAVNAGASAYFNALFGGDVTVNAGAFAGGAGFVGSVHVMSGGVLAPGNSIGTLYTGSASFASGSIFRVEVNGSGASDLLNASSAVTISGGTVDVLAAPGAYNNVTNYTIIQGASVSGAFSNVTSNLVFLDPSLAYDSSHVFLRLTRNDVLFTDVAETPNEHATASGVDALPHSNELWQQIISMSAAQARDAFNALSGEFHANLNGGGYGEALRSMGAIQDRISGAGVAQAVGPTMYASLSTPTGAGAPMDRTIWGEVLGDWGNVSGDGNADRFDFDRTGVVFGSDWGVRNKGLFGVAIGYREIKASEDTRASSGDVRAIDATLYAGARFGGLALSAQGGTSWRTIETSRHVIVGSVDQHLTADYDANSWYAQGRAGVPMADANGVIEPFAAWAFVSVDTDGFTEQSGSAALSVTSSVQSATFAMIGVRATRALGAGGRSGELFGSLGYTHANGDLSALNSMSFASNPGVTFDIAGAPISTNSFTVEAGVRWAVTDHLDLTAAYHGENGDSDRVQGVNVRLSLAY